MQIKQQKCLNIQVKLDLSFSYLIEYSVVI